MTSNDKGGTPSSDQGASDSALKPKRRRRRRKRGRRKPTEASVQSASQSDCENKPKAENNHGNAGSSTKGEGNRKPGKNRRRRGGGYPLRRASGGDGKSRRGKWAHTYAALDLGTNNCRLLVARPQEDGFRVIDAFSRTVRLGTGLNETGALSEEAMDKAVEAIGVCARKMERRSVTRSRCVATEACRLAENGDEFVSRVKKETGVELEIVSAKREAEFAAIGCTPLFDKKSDVVLVFDIGGGSTELIWLDQKRRREGRVKPEVLAWTSLPFGVVTLAEKFYAGGSNSETEDVEAFAAMTKIVSDAILDFEHANELREAFLDGKAHLIGNSGTVTTLAAVYLGLREYNRNKVDGMWIPTEDVKRLVSRTSELGYEGRAANPCIGEDRADLLLPGCAILNAICQTWATERMRVADRGLREGILMDLMEKADRGNGRRRRRRRRSRNRSDHAAAGAETTGANSTETEN